MIHYIDNLAVVYSNGWTIPSGMLKPEPQILGTHGVLLLYSFLSDLRTSISVFSDLDCKMWKTNL